MAKARAGVAYVRVDGTQYDLGGTMNIGVGDKERETLTGLDGVHGFKQMVKPNSIDGEFIRNPKLSIKKLQDATNVTVTAELDDGVTYVLRNAWLISQLELDVAEGKYHLRFEGPSMEEIGVTNG